MNLPVTLPYECGIRSDFLNSSNYKSTLEFAQKRNDNYLKFCGLIKSYYSDFQVMSKYINERIRMKQGDGLESIKQFKQFTIDFIKIIEEVATFKIQYYEQLEETEVDPIRAPTYEISNRIEKYSEQQLKFQEVFRKIGNIEQSITTLFGQFKKECKDPVVFFDQKYTKGKCLQLQQFMKNKQQLETQGNTLLNCIYANTVQFEKQIGFYRNKMLGGKYKIHQKLQEMSKGARQCLTQTLLTLYETVTQKHNSFQQLIKQQIRESTLLQKFKRINIAKIEEGTTDKLPQIIITATQQYNQLITQVQSIVKNLMDGFLLISLNCSHYGEVAKQIMEDLNKLYENDQNPTPEMIDSLDLFSFFSKKISQISNTLHLHQTNVIKLRQNINKHSEITLSLLKCRKSYKGQTQTSNYSSSSKNIQQITHLFDQLSYDYINDIIDKVYKLLQESLSALKNHFNVKYHKKKKNKVDDSMDISHVEEEYFKPHKKPSKKEFWLWKEFKNHEKYKRIQMKKEGQGELTKFINNFNQIKSEAGRQIQKYSCSLNSKKQIKGTIRLTQKNIFFDSASSSLNIPFDFVQEVSAKVKIFQKELTVQTSAGQIIFFHFTDLNKAEFSIQQQLVTASNSKKTVKKVSVQLSPEQVQFINNRKQKIQNQLQKLDGYVEQASAVFQNVTLDAVYDLVYSDKPFKFKGKQECCFMSYALKKGGGSNYTTTKYQPAGPKFYSLQDGRTFVNTPLISERVNNYDVPLPPIPFMPKTCQNKESVKIYWISDTQLQYLIKSQSRGAPYADSFFLNIFHIIKQQDKNVHVKIYFKSTFIKDTSMKGMISSKSAEEAQSKSTALLVEATKILKMGGATETTAGTQKQVQQEKQEQQQEEKTSGSKAVKKLQNQNKILIGILVAVIIINFLLRLF